MKSVILGLALAWFSTVAVAQTSVQALAKAAHAAEKAKATDKFADAPSALDAVGTPFAIKIKARDGDSTGIAPMDGYWTYKDGQVVISLTPSSAWKGYRSRDYSAINFAGTMTKGAPYVGENSFGVKRNVDVERWTRDAIAAVSIPIGDFHHTSRDIDTLVRYLDADGLRRLKTSFAIVQQLPGAEAKRLVQTTAILIEGTVAKLPDEPGVTACRTHVIGAKVDSPTDIYDEVCYVGANITRIAFVDETNGAVLKEWTAMPPVAELGPGLPLCSAVSAEEACATPAS